MDSSIKKNKNIANSKEIYQLFIIRPTVQIELEKMLS